MLKKEELGDRNSYFSKAKEDERIFVLLTRDICAPNTIRFWANERIRLGKNQRHDLQIQEAFECAKLMERERLQP